MTQKQLDDSLIHAIEARRTEEALRLIAEGACPNAVKGGIPVLIIAAGHGDYQVVEKLVEKGADVDAGDADNNTALMKAASCNHSNVIQLLLCKGATVDAQGAFGWTALMHAARLGNEAAVKMLLNNGANPNVRDATNKTALDMAKEGGYAEIIRVLEEAARHRSLSPPCREHGGLGGGR